VTGSSENLVQGASPGLLSPREFLVAQSLGFSPGVNAFSLPVNTDATRAKALHLQPGYSGGLKPASPD
jgi:hypothetical protein